MFSFKVYILSALLSLFSARYHPVHVSVLNVDYSIEKSAIKMLFKVNTADLELAVAHNYNVALNLGQPNENTEAMKHIHKYLTATFRVTINNKYQPSVVFDKKETIEEDTWLHLSIAPADTIRTLKLHNAILMDIFEDQTNLLIVSYNQKETGYRLGFYNREVELKN